MLVISSKKINQQNFWVNNRPPKSGWIYTVVAVGTKIGRFVLVRLFNIEEFEKDIGVSL